MRQNKFVVSCFALVLSVACGDKLNNASLKVQDSLQDVKFPTDSLQPPKNEAPPSQGIVGTVPDTSVQAPVDENEIVIPEPGVSPVAVADPAKVEPVTKTEPESEPEAVPAGTGPVAALPLPQVTELIPVENEDGELFAYDSKLKACMSDEDEGFNTNRIGQCSAMNSDVLKDMDLSNVDLSGSRWLRTLVDNVKLNGANLQGADFTNSKFTRTDFTGVKVEDAEFENVEISKSIIREYEVAEQMLESGVKFGLDNQLPKLLAEIDQLVKEDAAELPVADVRDEKGRKPASVKDDKRMSELKQKIKAARAVVEKNRTAIKNFRKDYREIKEKRDKAKEEMKRMIALFGNTKEELKKLVAERKQIAKKTREAKEDFVRSRDEKRRAALKKDLVALKSDQKKIETQIRDLKRKDSKDVPQVASLAKEVRALVDMASEKLAFVSGVRKENKDLRGNIQDDVAELKKLRGSEVASAKQ